MNKTNISYTRSHMSEILGRVQEGESILIMDRQRPVARLEPVDSSAMPNDLVRRGLVNPPRKTLNPDAFLARPLPEPQTGGDILDTLLADREESR